MLVAKVLISIPDDLLARLDREAARRGASRSALLQEAARRELGWPDPDDMQDAIASARRALKIAGSFESADLIRHERDSRDATDRRRL